MKLATGIEPFLHPEVSKALDKSRLPYIQTAMNSRFVLDSNRMSL